MPTDRPGLRLGRPAALAAGALLLIAAGALAARFLPDRQPRPDIVLLTVDTLRADRLGAYGHGAARTPNIDRLASQGTLFTEATTPFPRTTPALTSLLSGLWPQHHGSREVGQVPHQVTLLPQILKELGYTTLGVSANGAAGRNQGLDRGFDHFVDAAELRPRRADFVNKAALELLGHARPDAPLFLWAHYIDPHFPYREHEGWPAGSDTEPCQKLVSSVDGKRRAIGHVTSDLGGRSSRVVDSCRSLYDGEVAFTDHHIGELLDALADRPSEPLVIFTADHGENFGEDGLYYQHGPNVHDASLKVPLVISGPGVAARIDDGVARLEDLLPTLLSYLEVPRRRWPRVDGKDFSRRLGRWAWAASRDDRLTLAESGSALLLHSYRYLHSGRTNEFHCLNGIRFALCGKKGEEPALYEHATDPDLAVDVSERYPEEKRILMRAREVWPPETPRERAVRTRRYKLVERPLLRGGYRRYLYDLQADPLAEHDIASRRPEVVVQLGESLDRWTAELPSFVVKPRTEEQVEALRALGYVD